MALKLRTTKNVDRSKFLTSLVNKDKLTPILEKEIAKGEFAWNYRFEGAKPEDDAWHPSSHCTPSLHELYIIATTPPEARVLSSSLLKTFQVGQFWHQYLQEVAIRAKVAGRDSVERLESKYWGEPVAILAKEDLYYERLKPTYDPHDKEQGPLMRRWPKDAAKFNIIHPRPFHWVCGSGDLAPAVIPGHGGYLVDFKTMRGGDFSQQGLPERFNAKYECQINIYMDLFNLNQALIVAIQKDSPHDLKEIEYRRNQPLIDAIYEKWHVVSAFIDEGEAPDPDDDIPLPLEGPIER